MISYAQNAEDVVLWRVFANVENGFYVDVGAWHPQSESVTKCFYDQGWSGINIEPQAEKIPAFAEHRTRDINLQVAVSDKPGSMSLWIPSYSALATGDPSLLSESIPDYGNPVEQTVPCRTLDSILDEHAASKEISFLKVDVEGFEDKVLRSINLRQHRPIVLVVEATCPHTNEPKWHAWEPRLTSHGYTFALFDGLNRFYLRSESSELLKLLSVPANCLDGFITAREYELQQKLQKAQRLLDSSQPIA